jgi:peptidoglycan/xylan/chitin deacetylase (PgdA/CDA1 family)
VNSHEGMQARVHETNAASSLYLTFDDGPDPDWTPRILDVLAQANARATFFVIGDAARREPSLLRRAVNQGHAIGNHSKSHRHPWTMSASSARNEVREGAAIIEDILGMRASWYRAPHGRNRRCMTEAAQECGQSVVDWHLSAVDWGPLGKADRIKQRLEGSRPGNILLMHDGRNRHNRPDELMQVLPGFLQSLAQRGLQTSALAVTG